MLSPYFFSLGHEEEQRQNEQCCRERVCVWVQGRKTQLCPESAPEVSCPREHQWPSWTPDAAAQNTLLHRKWWDGHSGWNNMHLRKSYRTWFVVLTCSQLEAITVTMALSLVLTIISSWKFAVHILQPYKIPLNLETGLLSLLLPLSICICYLKCVIISAQLDKKNMIELK